MRALLVVLCAVATSGCWDFKATWADCQGTGACARPDGGEGADASVDEQDAGPVPEFVVVMPGQSADAAIVTSTGFKWEYPYPGAPTLNHLAVVSDQELWATGEDDTVVHLQHGKLPQFTRLPPGQLGLRSPSGARVVALPNREVWFAGEGSLQAWTGTTFVTREDWSFSPVVAVLGSEGQPWLGGSATDNTTCGRGDPVVREGPSPTAERCASRDDGFVVGLDPQGWALDTNGMLFRRSGSGWAEERPLGTPIDLDYGSLLALPGGSFLVTGASSGKLTAVDSRGQVSPQDVLPGAAADNGKTYRSLARTGDGGVLVVGSPGAFLHEATGSWVKEAPAAELQAVAAGPRSEYAVGSFGQALRRVSGVWKPLLPAPVKPVYDTFLDGEGGLWVVGIDGTVLRRDSLGWAAQVSLPTPGRGVTRTADGRFWAVGQNGVLTYDGGAWVPAFVNLPNDAPQPFTTAATSVVYGVAGTQPGNTWVFGHEILVGYEADGWWTGPKLSSVTVRDVFTTDAGTAWAATAQGALMFFDGAAWSAPQPLAGAGSCTSLWAPSSNYTYVACSGGNFRAFSDGRTEPWDASVPAFALTGRVDPSGNHVVIGADDSSLWTSTNGTSVPVVQDLGLGLQVNRVRAYGSKLYVIGDRAGPRGAVLSFDLP